MEITKKQYFTLLANANYVFSFNSIFSSTLRELYLSVFYGILECLLIVSNLELLRNNERVLTRNILIIIEMLSKQHDTKIRGHKH